MILLPCCTAWNRIKTWRAHLAVSFYSVPCATHAWIWMQKKQWTNWPRLSSAAKVLQSVHLCTGVLHTLSQKDPPNAPHLKKRLTCEMSRPCSYMYIHIVPVCLPLRSSTKNAFTWLYPRIPQLEPPINALEIFGTAASFTHRVAEYWSESGLLHLNCEVSISTVKLHLSCLLIHTFTSWIWQN